MTVTKVTETENFQSHTVFDPETQQIGGRCHTFYHNRMYTRGNVARRPLPTVGDFRGV